jgi:diaminopimelate decarboxylase
MNPPVRRLADWDAAALRAAAGAFETPLYALDLHRVRENCRRMRAAFPDADVLYAAKANTLDRVLETVRGEGVGVECASAGEVKRALDAGVPASEVHYTAVNPPERDLDRVVALAGDRVGLTVTAGARDTVARLRERGYDGRLCVRVSPGVGAGHHEKVATGADAKFGVAYGAATDVLADAARDFDVVGIHAHAGSGISGEDLAAHRELVGRMGELARRSPVDLEFVDVGGGFGVPYRPEEAPLDLEVVAAATREALGRVDATLTVEPGRYLVADAGVLLTAVNTDKTERGVVGVDAGMTDLLRPAMYGAHHEVRSLAPDAGERDPATVTVTGPICESGDVLAAERDLPRPQRGDLLAVGNAGAYGYEMASNYNSRPRPATVVRGGRSGSDAADDGWTLARRRETLADVTRTQVR